MWFFCSLIGKEQLLGALREEILLEAKDIRKYPSHLQKRQELRLFLFLVTREMSINVMIMNAIA